MGSNRKKGMKKQKDLDKPCRCGSGFFCHRHLAYGITGDITPKLLKVRVKSRAKNGARSEAMGGQH